MSENTTCTNCPKKTPVNDMTACVACALPTMKNFKRLQNMQDEAKPSAPCQCNAQSPCCQTETCTHRAKKVTMGMRMPNHTEIKHCEKVEPSHPCDPPIPCDPCKGEDAECKPALCLERIMNPAYAGEVTRCRPGAFFKVAVCERPEPPHPCDPTPCIPGFRKKVKCPAAAVCFHRIKNPEKKKAIKCPHESYEAYQPKEIPCSPRKEPRPCPNR